MSRARAAWKVAALGAAVALLACAAAPGPEPSPATSSPERVGPRSAEASGPSLPEPAAEPAHVLLVSIAGLPARAYRPGEPGDPPAWMPHLARLARAGAAADRVLPAAPASPGPVHATLVTGRTPSVHGIGGDHPLGDRGVEAARQRRADALRAPALWAATHEAGMPTALLGWPSSAGAPADWLFPELFPARIGESFPALLEGEATPEVLASLRRLGADRPEAGFPGPVRDEMLVALACERMSGPTPPRLMLLRLSQTEAALGRDGPDAASTREAFARVDAQIGRLLECLSAAGRLAQTALLVAGDGAVVPVHTLVQPNVALEAAGLLVPGPASPTGIARWEALARANGVSAFVYARDPETAVLARRALVEAARTTLAFRVVSAEEMLALGADREAWFGLEAEPGYVFGDGLRGGELVRPAGARGAWGGLAGEASADVGFVAWGAGLRGPLRIPALRQTDVAPTVARLLRIDWPPGEGRALVGVLRAPAVSVGPPRGMPGAR